MMYNEFLEKVEKMVDVTISNGLLSYATPSQQEYEKIIEPVYTYHPIFEHADAKNKTALLWLIGGYRLFEALYPVAMVYREYEEKQLALIQQKEKALEKYRIEV